MEHDVDVSHNDDQVTGEESEQIMDCGGKMHQEKMENEYRSRLVNGTLKRREYKNQTKFLIQNSGYCGVGVRSRMKVNELNRESYYICKSSIEKEHDELGIF